MEIADPQVIKWTYSRYKRFDNCPRQYYHLNVAKDFEQESTEALRSGTLVHKIAEDFVKDGTPIPDTHKYLNPVLDGVVLLPGGKVTELELAVKRDHTPCEFNDPDYWWRGIADLVVFDGNDRSKALLVDYKTGRNIRYADTRQLHVLSAALFSHFPMVKEITGSLFFVNLGEAVTQVYHRSDTRSLWDEWEERLQPFEAAHANGVWNPRSSPLCRYCPVVSCDHYRG